jgi:hypothetical protein
MAPLDGRAQRPVPGLGIPRPGEQVQPGIDPVQQLRGRKHPQPRGGQLQRQRQPVQPLTQPAQDRRLVHRHARRRGTLAQQRDRITGRQRRHREHVLGRQLQPLPAGSQHHQPVTGGQQPGHHVGHLRQQMLGVIQHDQHPASLKPGRHRALQAGSLVFPHAQHLRDRAQHLVAAADRRQPGPPQPVRELIPQPGRGLHRQPGLADPPGAGQRHQPAPRPGQHGAQPPDILIPADQSRGRHRKAAGRAQALQRREVLRQARAGQLIDPLRRRQVLQPVHAQIPHRHPGGQPGLRQQPGRIRQHHLPAMRGRRDPRRPVHIHPHIPVLVPHRLTRMQAHPDPHRNPTGPGVAGQGALRRHTARDRPGRRGEHHEETVPLGAHLMAATGRDRRAHNGTLRRQRLAVPVTQAAQQRRRSLDVAEEHRHGPGRELAHAPIIRRVPATRQGARNPARRNHQTDPTSSRSGQGGQGRRTGAAEPAVKLRAATAPTMKCQSSRLAGTALTRIGTPSPRTTGMPMSRNSRTSGGPYRPKPIVFMEFDLPAADHICLTA